MTTDYQFSHLEDTRQPNEDRFDERPVCEACEQLMEGDNELFEFTPKRQLHKWKTTEMLCKVCFDWRTADQAEE